MFKAQEMRRAAGWDGQYFQTPRQAFMETTINKITRLSTEKNIDFGKAFDSAQLTASSEFACSPE